MEIIRLQPFPLHFKHDSFIPDDEYVLVIYTSYSDQLHVLEGTADEDGVLDIELPAFYSRYDDEYRVEVYSKEGVDDQGKLIIGDMLLMDTMTIMRPYVDPDQLAETPDEIETAKMYEAIARSIIKSVTGGFNFQRKKIETTGLGADFLALPFRLNRILTVEENNVLVYDATNPEFVNVREYFITPDKSAIAVTGIGTWGRMQSRSVTPQLPASDSYTLHNTNDSPNIIQNVHGTPTFPSDWDYIVVAEVGWPVIPQDIKLATRLLVNDLRCNNLPYANAYIQQYKSDQFSLVLADGAFTDTGNKVVDRILSNYPRLPYRLGVL